MMNAAKQLRKIRSPHAACLRIVNCLTRSSPGQNRRLRLRKCSRGATIPEIMISMILLAAALLITAQSVALIAGQRRALQRKSMAAIEAANVLEQVAALPWPEIDQEKLARLEPSVEARRLLPDVRLRVDVQPTEQDLAEKRVEVAIDWITPGGHRCQPARLTAFVYQPTEAAEE